MKGKLKLFLPMVLICSMLFGSVCFASGIYGDNSLNNDVINQFNNMSTSDRIEVCKGIYPIISERLGFKTDDPYKKMSDIWDFYRNQNIIGTPGYYSTPEDYWNGWLSGSLTRELFVYLEDGVYKWYDSFADYLAHNIKSKYGQYVVDDTAPLYQITNYFIDKNFDDLGVVTRQVYSFRNINSSNFPTLDAYNSFINLVNNYKSSRFILCYRGSASAYFAGTVRNYFTVVIPKVNANLYATSKNVGKYYALCNDNGVNLGSNNYYIFVYDGSTWRDLTSSYGRYGARPPFILGGPSLSVGSSLNLSGNDLVGTEFYLYSTNDDVQNYRLFTSLSGWINNNGHFEVPYTLTENYGKLPNVNINSSTVTNYYNQIYNNGSGTINNGNIFYPSGYIPDGSNSYDQDTHTLKFDGIGSLLSSIGDLIGSLINGIANGLANIISSISSVAKNMISFFTDGVIFEFLKAFMSWLPEPIPTLLSALFTLTVLFAVIKLVKGALA